MFFKSTRVSIGSVKVNNLDQLSSVSYGSNFKLNRNVSAKKTQGFGQQHGDSTFRSDVFHMVLDEDMLDMMTAKETKNRKL